VPRRSYEAIQRIASRFSDWRGDGDGADGVDVSRIRGPGRSVSGYIRNGA